MTKPKQMKLVIHSVEHEEPVPLPKNFPDFLVALVNDAIASCRGPRNGADVKVAVEHVLERLTDEQRGHLWSEVAPTVYGLLHGDIECIDEKPLLDSRGRHSRGGRPCQDKATQESRG